jgi:hypothetical protein
MTGYVDTDMSRGLEIPKASPESLARAIFDGAKEGEEPDEQDHTDSHHHAARGDGT